MNIEPRQQLFNQHTNNTVIKLWRHLSKDVEQAAKISSCTGLEQLPTAGKQPMATSPIQLRCFYLDGRHLYYTKDTDTKVKGCLDLTMMYMTHYELEGNESQGQDFTHAIMLQKGKRFTSVYLRSEEDLIKWVEKLTPYVVRDDFHNVFKATGILGEGSFAKVFRVRQQKDGKIFAAKAYLKQELNQRALEALHAEINALKLLVGKKEFIQFKGIFETENSVYLLTDCIEGDVLFQIPLKTKFNQSQRLKILAQLSKALSTLEEKKIIHRDLKPDNIMVTPAGKITIIDFGLSLVAPSDDDIFVKAGTPGFLAPEILQQPRNFSGVYSTQTDLYAIGVIHYCMVTGTHPFYSTDYNKVFEMNKKGEIDFKRREFCGIRKLEISICQGLLSPDPDYRTDVYTLDMDIGFLKQQIEDEEAQDDLDTNKKLIMKKYTSICPSSMLQGLNVNEKRTLKILSKADTGLSTQFKECEGPSIAF